MFEGIRVLTFDVYGTLIDWETGLKAELVPWAEHHGLTITDEELLIRFGRLELAWETLNPRMPYTELLTNVHRDLARQLGVPVIEADAAAFGRSVGDWPAFPDTVSALTYLKQHFRLCVLSNVDNRSVVRSLPRLGVAFDYVYTAEEIGSYKPDLRNFGYAIDRLARDGVAKDEILHVAQSLLHDHEPSNRLGLRNAWIDRRLGQGGGAVAGVSAMPSIAIQCSSMSELVERHREWSLVAA